MLALNYIYFLIITYVGVKYLFAKRVTMANPMQRGTLLEMNGREAFWVLTFGTGLLAFSAPGALDLMAIRLLVLEVLLIVGLIMADQRPTWSLPLVMYVLFLVWIVCGCFYSPSPMYGLRVVLKYIYPLVVALFASAVVRDTEIFVKAGVVARWVAVISIIVFFTPLRKLFLGVFWYGTAAAINYISIMIFSLALFFYTDERRKNLFYAVLFIIPCFLWVFRTSIMGSLIAIMGFFFIKYRLRSLPIIASVLILGVVAVFTIPSLRQKMFVDENKSIEEFQEGQISMNDVNTNARSSMWEHLEDRFFVGHDITGSGTGSVQNYMYNNRIFGGLKVPHSDFVQLKCDNGLIGLVLYLGVSLLIFAHCFLIFQSAKDNVIKLCAIVAGASIIGVVATLYSDNVVNYSMATLSMPYGFYGMTLGIAKHRKS